MLYIIGLGIGDQRDITLRGLEAVKECDKIYIEAYTSLLSFGLSTDGLSTLENLYGKPLTLADRETVEEKADDTRRSSRFARLGSEDEMIVAGSMKQLLLHDFGAPLHCLLIV